jgi:restriction endonuclease S subunit
MPPKRESKKVMKIETVESEDNGISFDNILNPIENDAKETTTKKKISIKKKTKSKESDESNSINELTNTTSSASIEPVFIKKKKTNKLIFEKSTAEIANTITDENFKKKFLDFLNEMHNLLRGCAVTGDPALDDILNTLFLCYIEDRISDKGKFDFENSEKECFETIRTKIKDYSPYLKVSHLLKHTEEFKKNEGQLNSIAKCGKILKLHPTTKLLFKDDNFINCPDPVIFNKLLTKCKKFSKEQNIFEHIDIAGMAYEYMSTKHAGNGGVSKEMGQYFTERLLMWMLFQLLDEKDINDLGIDNNSTIGDEFCATFGFPLMARKFLKEKFNIDIQDKNMYGIEYHERLSRFAIMNAIFSMENFENITRADSFITNVTPHLDLSIHNVPFGHSMSPEIIKTTYIDFLKENPNKGYPELKDYIPFCNKKIDALLASQVVLYKTKKIGIMIIKDGEETSGKNTGNYRKWFSENSIILKILKIPSGSFTFTGTKTICIYFIKKEGKMTENIQFLELSDNGNKIVEICNVSMNDLKQNNYSWDSNAYILDEEMERIMAKSKCEFKLFNNVLKIVNTGNFNSGDMDNNGNYPFYRCTSVNPQGFHSECNVNYEEYLLLISAGGSKNNLEGENVGLGKCYYINEKTSTMSGVFAILPLPNLKINLKYYFHYLNINRLKTNKIAKFTTNLGKISKEDLENKLYLPLPSIEIQNEIVQMLDDLTQQKQLLNDRKNGIENQMKYHFENQIKKNKDSIIIEKLENICDMSIKGNTNSKDASNTGEYPFFKASVTNPNGTHNTYCFDGPEYILFIKSGGNANKPLSLTHGIGKCYLQGGKTSGNSEVIRIITNNKYEYLTIKYLYYFLRFNQLNIQKLAKYATNLGHIEMEQFKNFNTIIFTVDIQKEIIDYLDKLENKKNSIDDELKDIDDLMKSILEQSYE